MNLVAYLNEAKVDYEFIDKSSTVHTADASLATGIPLERIVKALVCLGDGSRAYVAVIPGDRRLRIREVARAFGLKKARLCPFDSAHRYSGYAPGATPPVNYHDVNGVVVDSALLGFDEIYGGGGSNEKLVKLRTEDVVRLNGAFVRDISFRDSEKP